jgi:hypothetical protein
MMTRPPAAVDVELDTLRHLLTAAHLAGCADWAEAAGKAEADVRPWLTQIPAGHRRIEVHPLVLRDVAEAARAVLVTRGRDQGWREQLAADLEQVARICPGPRAA